jgi:signal transduction histidine kinase
MMSVVAALLARRTVVAWLPVVLLVPVLVADAALSGHGPDVTVWGVLAAVVGCLPLVLRRQLPFAAMAPLITAGVTLVLWQLEPENTVVLIPVVALAELAARGDRRRVLWIGLAVVPCVVISVLPFADDAGDLAAIVVRNFAFCLLALAAGDIARSRREAADRQLAMQEQMALAQLQEERLRIAREVHDVVAHAMVGINVQAGVAAHRLRRDPENAEAALRDIKAVSGAALADLRATLGVLRGSDEAAPLGPAMTLADLDQLTRGLRAAGVAVALDVAELPPLPAPVHAAGYRIVQEALTNVLRHARATSVTVTVAATESGGIAIEVVDDGVGPGGHEGAGGPGGAGHGLRGMRERASALGGTVESGPGPGGGWRVLARLPGAPVGVPA